MTFCPRERHWPFLQKNTLEINDHWGVLNNTMYSPENLLEAKSAQFWPTLKNKIGRKPFLGRLSNLTKPKSHFRAFSQTLSGTFWLFGRFTKIGLCLSLDLACLAENYFGESPILAKSRNIWKAKIGDWPFFLRIFFSFSNFRIFPCDKFSGEYVIIYYTPQRSSSSKKKRSDQPFSSINLSTRLLSTTPVSGLSTLPTWADTVPGRNGSHAGNWPKGPEALFYGIVRD